MNKISYKFYDWNLLFFFLFSVSLFQFGAKTANDVHTYLIFDVLFSFSLLLFFFLIIKMNDEITMKSGSDFKAFLNRFHMIFFYAFFTIVLTNTLTDFGVSFIEHFISDSTKIPIVSDNQETLNGFASYSKNAFFISMLSTCVLAPFVEELFFRRILFGNPNDYSKKSFFNFYQVLRVLFATFLFAFIHVDYEFSLFWNSGSLNDFLIFVHEFIPYLFYSIALGIFYLRYKNIFASIFLHALINTIPFLSFIIKFIIQNFS